MPLLWISHRNVSTIGNVKRDREISRFSVRFLYLGGEFAIPPNGQNGFDLSFFNKYVQIAINIASTRRGIMDFFRQHDLSVPMISVLRYHVA
jgi:hypothetical protein